jgi:hypothetical protein
LCVGFEKLLDNAKVLVTSDVELDSMMELTLQYNHALSAPQSGWRGTTGYLHDAAMTFLSTQKIASPRRQVRQYLGVVAQPAPALTEPPTQPVVTQVDSVVEDQALIRDERENETAIGIWCKRICLPTLTSILALNSSLITERYSIFPAGCIRHNNSTANKWNGTNKRIDSPAITPSFKSPLDSPSAPWAIIRFPDTCNTVTKTPNFDCRHRKRTTRANQPPRRGHYFRPYILSNLFQCKNACEKRL